jgi:hypothetical protein
MVMRIPVTNRIIQYSWFKPAPGRPPDPQACITMIATASGNIDLAQGRLRHAAADFAANGGSDQ